MTKDNKLYFLPFIARAFESENLDISFREALIEISKLGQEPGFEQGFQQFEQFINIGLKDLHANTEYFKQIQTTIKQRLLITLAANTFEGPKEVKDRILKAIQSNDTLKAEYEHIQSNLREINEEHNKFEIQLFREGSFISELELGTKSARLEFPSIKPGFYSLRLSNGRILWQDEIKEEDVIWSKAFPGEDYSLAADTSEFKGRPTISEELSTIEMAIEIYAGLETGRLIVIYTIGNRD